MITAEKKKLRMTEISLEDILELLHLYANVRVLPNDNVIQFKLTTSGFEPVNINFYGKRGMGTVLVQPWDSPLARKIRAFLKLYTELRDYRIKNKK